MIVHEIDGVEVDKTIINTRKDFDFVVPNYEQMIYEMSIWVKTHRELYPHYCI